MIFVCAWAKVVCSPPHPDLFFIFEEYIHARAWRWSPSTYLLKIPLVVLCTTCLYRWTSIMKWAKVVQHRFILPCASSSTFAHPSYVFSSLWQLCSLIFFEIWFFLSSATVSFSFARMGWIGMRLQFEIGQIQFASWICQKYIRRFVIMRLLRNGS